MLLIVSAFFLWIPAVIGFGSIPLSVFRGVATIRTGSINLVYALFLGSALMSGLANLLNFWTPVSPAVSLATLAIGWLLLFSNRNQIRTLVLPNSLIARRHRRLLAAAIGGVILALFASLGAGQPMALYDAGLYHLQSVKWTTESILPFGLANLHGRLGFNSAWFSVAALIELPWMVGKSSFALNGMVYLVYGLLPISAIRRGLRQSLAASDLYLMATGVLWLAAVWVPEMSSPSPEVPIMFLTLLLVYVLMRAVESRDERPFTFFLSAILAVFGVTIKLSGLPLLLVPIVILVLWVRDSRYVHVWRSVARTLALVVFICMPLGLIWSIRGILMSGCVVYPVDATCIASLDWSVPRQAVVEESLWIRSWARSPGNYDPETVLSDGAWFMPWFRGLFYNNLLVTRPKNVVFRYAAAFTALGALFWLVARASGRRKPFALDASLIAAGALVASSLIFWFLSAPDTRFAYGTFSAAGTLVFCLGVGRFRDVYRVDISRFIGVASFVWMVGVGVVHSALMIMNGRVPLSTWPLIPSAQVVGALTAEPQHSDRGVQVYIPASANDDRCWAAPIPCTPHLSPGLRITTDAAGRFVKFYVERDSGSQTN